MARFSQATKSSGPHNSSINSPTLIKFNRKLPYGVYKHQQFTKWSYHVSFSVNSNLSKPRLPLPPKLPIPCKIWFLDFSCRWNHQTCFPGVFGYADSKEIGRQVKEPNLNIYHYMKNKIGANAHMWKYMRNVQNRRATDMCKNVQHTSVMWKIL